MVTVTNMTIILHQFAPFVSKHEAKTFSVNLQFCSIHTKKGCKIPKAHFWLHSDASAFSEHPVSNQLE